MSTPNNHNTNQNNLTRPDANTNHRKNASSACQRCKQGKRKCDSQWPCSNCHKTGSECVFDAVEDGRRAPARKKRGIEELQFKREALDALLDSLRSSDDQHIQGLLSLIRRGAPIEELVQYTKDHPATWGKIGLPLPPLDKGREKSRRTGLSIAALCDNFLFKVPAKPWTDITDDDDLVSELVSLYVTWWNPYYRCVDVDLFIRDMKEGDLSSLFCSPLLVNSILVLGAQLSDNPAARVFAEGKSVLAQKFHDEATRLWAIEQGRVRVTTVQAAVTLTLGLTVMGKDRIGWMYIEQISSMSRDLMAQTARTTADLQVRRNIEKSQSLALWACFLVRVSYGMAYMKPTNVKRPRVPRPYSTDDISTAIEWTPYPRQNPVARDPMAGLFEELCNLYELGASIHVNLIAEDESENDRDQRLLQDTVQNLEEWNHNLPEYAQLSDRITPSPLLFDLHLTYYWFRLTLYRAIMESQTVIAKETQSQGSDNEPTRRARDGRQNCIDSVASIFRHFTKEYGNSHHPILVSQTGIVVCFELIEDLDEPYSQEIFHQLCTVLVALTRRWLEVKGIVRMIYITAKEKGKTLLPQTEELLNGSGGASWGENDHLSFEASTYPNFPVGKEDPSAAGLGEILERWAAMNLDEEVEGANAGASDDGILEHQSKERES